MTTVLAMTALEVVILLVGAVAGLVWLARRAGLPYPVVLLVGGLAIGLIPGLPELELDPEVIFLVFVPPLVHAAGYTASPKRLKTEARPIALAAVVLVVVTIGVVAVAARLLLPDLGWGPAFVLGAVLAPTDLVAAAAVFRRLGAPERIVTLIEGESLVNDGTALTAWRIAVGATAAATYSLGDAAVELVLVAGGGTVLGLAVGWLVAQMRRRLDDALIEITVTLFTPYVAFIAAEELGLSGVLAAVVSGLYLGTRDWALTSPSTRLQAYGFWGVLTFVLESLLFILVGLQFPQVVEDLGAGELGELVGAGVLIALAIVVVRLLHQFTLLELDERLGGREPISWRERTVIGWSGMRGALSLAIALAIPVTIDSGAPFPDRDTIIFLTLVVIAVTLIVQGLTLPLLVRRLALPAEAPAPRRQALVRFESVQAALESISQEALDGDTSPALVERARELYTTRAGQLAGECRTGVAASEGDTEEWLRLRLRLLGVERGRLAEMRDAGEITNALLTSVQSDLDLEETRIERRLGEPA